MTRGHTTVEQLSSDRGGNHTNNMWQLWMTSISVDNWDSSISVWWNMTFQYQVVMSILHINEDNIYDYQIVSSPPSHSPTDVGSWLLWLFKVTQIRFSDVALEPTCSDLDRTWKLFHEASYIWSPHSLSHPHPHQQLKLNVDNFVIISEYIQRRWDARQVNQIYRGLEEEPTSQAFITHYSVAVKWKVKAYIHSTYPTHKLKEKVIFTQ